MAEVEQIQIQKVVAHTAAMKTKIDQFFGQLLEDGEKLVPKRKSVKKTKGV